MRIRFSLRIALIAIALVALPLALAYHRASQQRWLKSMFVAHGTYTVAPDKWLPEWIQSFFGEDYCSHLQEVIFYGLAAPVYGDRDSRLIDFETLNKILNSKPLRSVDTITLGGSAINDDVLNRLIDFPNLKSVTIYSSTVTMTGKEQFLLARPKCSLHCYLRNSPHSDHTGQLTWTDDLDLFISVHRGDKAAARKLLGMIDETPKGNIATISLALGNAKGDEIAEMVREAIASEDARVRRAIAGAFTIRQDYEALAACLDDDDPLVRLEAIQGLGHRAGVPSLVDALADQDTRVRQAALFTLIRDSSDSAIQARIDAVRHHDPDVRWRVVDSFRLVPMFPIDILTEALQDDAPVVRAVAAQALGMSGDKLAIAPLTIATHDADESVRQHADVALERLTVDRSFPTWLLSSPDVLDAKHLTGSAILGSQR